MLVKEVNSSGMEPEDFGEGKLTLEVLLELKYSMPDTLP